VSLLNASLPLRKAFPVSILPLSLYYRSAIAHVYPAYQSYRALQRRRPEEMGTWLTYWTVLGAFHSIEYATDSFVWWYFLMELNRLDF
jgi:hypothetical protein